MKNLHIKIKKNKEKIIQNIIKKKNKKKKKTKEVKMVGQGERGNLMGLFFQHKNDNVKFHVNIVHKAPDTYSRVDIRAVLYDHANFDNDGMIRINHGAKKADGFYTSKVLLFDDAKGRSVPSLEIDENELK